MDSLCVFIYFIQYFFFLHLFFIGILHIFYCISLFFLLLFFQPYAYIHRTKVSLATLSLSVFCKRDDIRFVNFTRCITYQQLIQWIDFDYRNARQICIYAISLAARINQKRPRGLNHFRPSGSIFTFGHNSCFHMLLYYFKLFLIDCCLCCCQSCDRYTER